MSNESLRLEWIDPAELQSNPANWRTHPAPQVQALADVIKEVGWAGALLYNERTKRLVDGHARRDLFAGQKVPVLIGSWDEATEAKILATLDPIAAMAQADAGKLDALLREVTTGSEALQGMLAGLAASAGVIPPEVGSGLEAKVHQQSLSDRFLVPPFSVLDARQGYWQERKRAWLSLGIQSELGRGGQHDKHDGVGEGQGTIGAGPESSMLRERE